MYFSQMINYFLRGYRFRHLSLKDNKLPSQLLPAFCLPPLCEQGGRILCFQTSWTLLGCSKFSNISNQCEMNTIVRCQARPAGLSKTKGKWWSLRNQTEDKTAIQSDPILLQVISHSRYKQKTSCKVCTDPPLFSIETVEPNTTKRKTLCLYLHHLYIIRPHFNLPLGIVSDLDCQLIIFQVF